MKIKLFTHTDLDGVSCAIVALMKYNPTDIDIEYCSYNNINEKIKLFIESGEYKNYNCVYITDISVNEYIAKLIDNIKYECCIKLLDHHKTALKLNKYEWATVQIENNNNLTCGTELFYNYLTLCWPDIVTSTEYGAQVLYDYLTLCQNIEFIEYQNEKTTQFVELVRSYDTWDWEKNNNQLAKDLNDILYILGNYEFVNYYSKFLTLNNLNYFKLPEEHTRLLKYKRIETESYIAAKLKTIEIIKDSDGNYVAVVTADYNIDDLGSTILYKHDIDYVAMYNGIGYSLRSTGDFDVSEIAKKHGGGGHKNSAGFTVNSRKVHKYFL